MVTTQELTDNPERNVATYPSLAGEDEGQEKRWWDPHIPDTQ